MANLIRRSLKRVTEVFGPPPSGRHKRGFVPPPPVLPQPVYERPQEWARLLEAARLRRLRAVPRVRDEWDSLVPAYVLSPDEFGRFRFTRSGRALGVASEVSG